MEVFGLSEPGNSCYVIVNDTPIRTHVYNEANLFYNAADIADMLGYAKTTNMLKIVPVKYKIKLKDLVEKGPKIILTIEDGKLIEQKNDLEAPSRSREGFKGSFLNKHMARGDSVFISDFGLYHMLQRGNSPVCDVFRESVSKVVHTIKLTGKYTSALPEYELLKLGEPGMPELKVIANTATKLIKVEVKDGLYDTLELLFPYHKSKDFQRGFRAFQQDKVALLLIDDIENILVPWGKLEIDWKGESTEFSLGAKKALFLTAAFLQQIDILEDE